MPLSEWLASNIPCRMTDQQIADATGQPLRSVQRDLRRLRDEGRILSDNTRICPYGEWVTLRTILAVVSDAARHTFVRRAAAILVSEKLHPCDAVRTAEAWFDRARPAVLEQLQTGTPDEAFIFVLEAYPLTLPRSARASGDQSIKVSVH